MEESVTPPRSSSLESLARIVRAEFIEMPGMRLTEAQFRRLWHLSEDLCDQLTTLLLQDGFLARDEQRRWHSVWTRTP